MQVNQPQGGSAEASTNTTDRTRPPLASHRLSLPSICDICGKARSTRKHQACSRLRQQLKAAEWATVLAEKVAKAAKGRRYAR